MSASVVREAFAVAALAKRKGYATEAKNGKLRFVIVEYDQRGKSTITPRTAWLSFAEAREIACVS